MKDYDVAFANTDGNSFPDTGGREASGPGETDGTEYIKAMVDDAWGARQALLDVARLTPNGIDEAATVDLTKPSGRKSQMLDAMFELFERRPYCIDSGAGTANAIQVTSVGAPFEFYRDRMIVMLEPFEKNTGATTINVDGLGNILVVQQDGGNMDGGELRPDYVAILVYDLGNDKFRYINIEQGPATTYDSTGALFATAAIIPYDDTIPQNTEGAQLLTATITPTNKDSILRVQATIHAGTFAANNAAIIAAFRDATANAFAVASFRTPSGSMQGILNIDVEVPANDTVATTIKLRVGSETGSTVKVNGDLAGRIFGSAMLSTLRVTEILPKVV
jgi:hypothetical protein